MHVIYIAYSFLGVPYATNSFVYLTVLFAGYFDYVKQLGYNWGHIWAFSPSEDETITYSTRTPPTRGCPNQNDCRSGTR